MDETYWYEINEKDEWILFDVTEPFFNDFGIDKDSGTGAFRPCTYSHISSSDSELLSRFLRY